jgi:hypothetical protein
MNDSDRSVRQWSRTGDTFRDLPDLRYLQDFYGGGVAVVVQGSFFATEGNVVKGIIKREIKYAVRYHKGQQQEQSVLMQVNLQITIHGGIPQWIMRSQPNMKSISLYKNTEPVAPD